MKKALFVFIIFNCFSLFLEPLPKRASERSVKAKKRRVRKV